MTAPAPRTRRALRWAALPLALGASALLVWQSSYAAFSSTTENPTNSWTTGTVKLTDNDNGAALFTATNLKPGATGSRCIVVTSTGSLASTVKLYGSGLSAPAPLGEKLTLTVTQGTGGGATFGDCTGFTGQGQPIYTGTLAGFTSTSWATGYGSWGTTGAASESRTYKFDYVLAADTPNTAQGQTAQVAFTWEAQNN